MSAALSRLSTTCAGGVWGEKKRASLHSTRQQLVRPTFCKSMQCVCTGSKVTKKKFFVLKEIDATGSQGTDLYIQDDAGIGARWKVVDGPPKTSALSSGGSPSAGIQRELIQEGDRIMLARTKGGGEGLSHAGICRSRVWGLMTWRTSVV